MSLAQYGLPPDATGARLDADRDHPRRTAVRSMDGEGGTNGTRRQGHGFRVRGLYLLWVIAFALFLSSCAQQPQIPTKQFTAYRQAFDTARVAASDVLGGYADIARQAKREIAAVKKAGKPGHRYDKLPPLFKPSAVGKDSSLDDDIAVRLQALETIARYNGALLDLVEGKPVQQLGASVKSLAGTITTLFQDIGASIPGIGLASPVVSKFLALAEKARQRREFARAIQAGRPVVSRIIDFLITDTTVYDRLRRSLAQRRIDQATDEALFLVADMAKLARGYAEPRLLTDIAKAKQATAKEMQSILRMFGEDPSVLPYKDLPGTMGQPTYTQIVQSQLEQFLRALRAAGEKRKETIADVVDYQGILVSYVKLLRQVDAALDAVQVNLNAPVDMSLAVNEMAGLTLEVRGGIASLLSP